MHKKELDLIKAALIIRDKMNWRYDITLDLSGAILSGANLTGVNLQWANMERTIVIHADLRGANLRGADLSGADLTGADLRWADLRWAHLLHADLRWANLSGADLRGTYLWRADLSWTKLTGIKPNWNSRDLISQLLFQWSDNHVPRQMLAGLVLISHGLCWGDFLVMDIPEKEAALDYLKTFETPDNPMPDET